MHIYDWTAEYQEMVLETNNTLLSAKIERIEKILRNRMDELLLSPDPEQYYRVIGAIEVIQALKAKRLPWSSLRH